VRPDQIREMRQTSLRITRLEARVFGHDLTVGDFGVRRPGAASFDETTGAHRPRPKVCNATLGPEMRFKTPGLQKYALSL
jgi:hypothetical protein